MKNELGRKITSLTIMTIMVAGGVTFAVPGFMPEAIADEKLMYVSVENPDFGNEFGGGQIVEIIVRDNARSETDEIQPEPTVEVNNERLRMVQGADGYWYAYIGSTAAMATAAANANVNYGHKCGSAAGDSCIQIGTDKGNAPSGEIKGAAGAHANLSVSKVATVYWSQLGVGGAGEVIDGAATLSNYPGATGTHDGIGQVNMTTGSNWPFIQAFEFSVFESFDIVYEKPGQDEVVSVTFSAGGADDFAKIESDRTVYPPGAEVHLTIWDQQLNLDPTTEDTVVFLTNGTQGVSWNGTATYAALTNDFGDNGKLIVNADANGLNDGTTPVVRADVTLDYTPSSCAAATTEGCNDGYFLFWETGSNTGIFVNTDDADDANMIISNSAKTETTATIDYNDSAYSIKAANFLGDVTMIEEDVGEAWDSGEGLTVLLTDEDRNKNSASDEDIQVKLTDRVPFVKIGTPTSAIDATDSTNGTINVAQSSGVAEYRAKVAQPAGADGLSATTTLEFGALAATFNAVNTTGAVQRYISYDVSSYCSDLYVNTGGQKTNTQLGLGTGIANKGVISMGTADISAGQDDVECRHADAVAVNEKFFVSYDLIALGATENHAIYRVEVEETDDNTGVFEGSLEYIMVNQNNVDEDLSASIATNDQDPIMFIHEDHTGVDAPRVQYNDTDSDGIFTDQADQVDINTYSGVVELDSESYKVADTVTITVTDMDLNTDSELIDVYVVQSTSDVVGDNDGASNTDTAGTDHVLDVYFGDVLWDDVCESTYSGYGLYDTGFQLTETDATSGVFSGTFQIPEYYCTAATTRASTTGQDMFINYVDYRDAGANTIETGAGAAIAANTGSVALDRSVYPVPFTWGQFTDHADTAVSGNDGNVTVTVLVTDPDYDTSPTGQDVIASTCTDSNSVSCVTVTAVRGSTTVTLASAFELKETAPSSGVFEYEFQINANTNGALGNTALRQGDVITANYIDKTDAAGNEYLVTDSSTLDLRTGSLISDKSVYVIGSDAIITLIDADLNLDSGSTESYTLNLVEWDSDGGTTELGTATTPFDAEPAAFRETGSDTGIFQTVIEIPTYITSSTTGKIDQGEKIDLEYVDYGPAGENNYNDDTEDVELSIYTSNFGATIELDSKVYTWTDRVFVTIVAPDHNTDSALVDEIGGATDKTLTAQTRESKLTAYKMVETGPDTGIFWGEITLAGFAHDSDGDGTNDGPFNWVTTSPAAAGPTDGLLKASEADGVTVSFEYTEDATVVSSSLVRWNIGEVSFSEDAFLSSGSAVVSVVDPDMNTNPDSTENFKVDVYSDSDSGGIELTVTETNESTGVFEATLFFTTDDASSGHSLRVSEGDSITAEYSDHTLPEPYSTSDDIDVSATAVIGTSTPPLERAPVANARVVDAFGNSLAEISVDQQVQIEADLVNGQDGDQSFAYLVQVQDSDGVTVSLAWITGQLSAGQSFSPALSWIPDASGSYEATVFVWESVDNPTALSDTATVSITVV